MILLGIDTGGTFTDFVCLKDSMLVVHKVPSTPKAPDQAIWQGLIELGLERELANETVLIVHGTTVATNAALESKGARTVFVTNRGFADMLTLGRQARPELYQLQPIVKPPPVPSELCLEVDTRRDADGILVKPLKASDIAALIETIKTLQPEAVAINLLFSYLNSEEEIVIANHLTQSNPSLFVSCSARVLPEYKEYERGIATWLNAYLGPLMQRYLRQVEQRVRPSKVTVMQSSGGTIAAHAASDKAVNLLLSGPAGGLAAVKFLSEKANLGNLMTFDMGGTSTDVALVAGELAITNEGRIGPYPVAVPMVDMHTIGAGGGSIAFVDSGGLLQVGPESAGADPGPACYGNGGKCPTVTDANVVLGRLPHTNKLGGTLEIDFQAAIDAIQGLANPLGMTVAETAAGIVAIANEHMANALRVISVQRGHDPKDYRLCSFGGAGGLHVCELAEQLGMQHALVPVNAGVLSALGLLVAPRERQLSRSIQQALTDISLAAIENVLTDLLEAGQTQLIDEGVKAAQIQNQASVDLRYLGQSAHINVPFLTLDQCQQEFQQRHKALYGHHLDMAVELVNVRQRVYAEPTPLNLPLLEITIPAKPNLSGDIPLYQRNELAVGQEIQGPALICETTATTALAQGWLLSVDRFGNLLLDKHKSPA